MKFSRIVYIILLLVVSISPTLIAQDESIIPKHCPEGFPDDPSFPFHMSNEAIMNNVFSFEEILNHGKLLFTADFNICDGRGRPATTATGAPRDPDGQPAFTRVSGPEANSCVGCHNEPAVGGDGDIVDNVFVPGQADPVVESISGEFTNPRNTLGMFGAGAIEMLAREMTTELHMIRDEALEQAANTDAPVTVSLDTKGINFGSITALPDGSFTIDEIEGIDHDLIVRPFHQSGTDVSLRKFTVNGMNQHHGMQAEEHFDLVPERGVDFDQDGIANELTIGDITAVTLWQASLGVPGRVLPSDPEEQAVVERGEELFSSIGCSTCHRPELTLNSPLYLEPNPYNPSDVWKSDDVSYSFDLTSQGPGPYPEFVDGQVVLRAYTDLKRHNLCDPPETPDAIRHFCNEQFPMNRPEQDGLPGEEFFLTRRLWDAGNSQPYGHVGDLTTLTEAILVHGGEGRESRDAFEELSFEDKRAIVQFLKTLQILPEGSERVVYESE